MPEVTAQGAFALPFAEQIDFFRRKLNLPTERWDDIKKAAHDRAFIVAGVSKADLLQDLRDAVDKAVAQGASLGEFRKDFWTAVKKAGWTGWTGEGTKAGEAWRTRVIYQTNLRTSYAAGRWAQLNDPDVVKLRPYWRYVHNDSVTHPRPHHKAWGDAKLTLPHDHPFWATHFSPNGWGCGCRCIAVKAPGEDAQDAPPEGWDSLDPKTGAPPGIDKGWGYAPGANAATPLLELVDQKLMRFDSPIGAAMWEELKPALAMEQRLALADLVDATVAAKRETGAAVVAHVMERSVVAALAAQGAEPQSAAVWLRDHELIHALRDTKAERGTALPLAVWRDLPRLLDQAEAYLDTSDSALIYAFDAGGALGKVVVRIDFLSRVRDGGKRLNVRANFIRTGGVIDPADLTDPRYVRLGEK